MQNYCSNEKQVLKKQLPGINIAISQGDDYTGGCLLDYNYFKDCCKMTAIEVVWDFSQGTVRML